MPGSGMVSGERSGLSRIRLTKPGLQGPPGPPGVAGAIWNTPISVTSTSSTPRLPGDFLEVDVSGGSAITITLPTSTTVTSDSRPVKIIDVIGTSTSETTAGFALTNVTVLPSSGQTIYGGSSYILNRSAISPEFYLVGTDWKILGGIVF